VTAATSPLATRDLGPAPEPVLAKDLAKHALILAPIAIGICAAIWGTAGAASAAYALTLVTLNFLAAAALLAWAARISYGLLMGVALFGFLVRLALIGVAVLAVKDAAWVEPLALGLTLVASYLGLLFWELRYVSINLAHPGLKPTPKETSLR
jgi:hypothetical protein